MIQFSESIIIDSGAEKIFELYQSVEDWNSWDPDVRSSSLNGPFVKGACGRLKPSTGPEAKIKITSVHKNKSFTVESNLPLCTMRFEHEIEASNKKVRVTHRVSFLGPMAFFFGRIIGKSIRKGLPQTLMGLKKSAEKA